MYACIYHVIVEMPPHASFCLLQITVPIVRLKQISETDLVVGAHALLAIISYGSRYICKRKKYILAFSIRSPEFILHVYTQERTRQQVEAESAPDDQSRICNFSWIRTLYSSSIKSTPYTDAARSHLRLGFVADRN
ncbi:hypothetical protein F2Q69_00028700 [Brassica cretica]|uniref:Uncharacterized protein n=1 Tax=Brassica cretica TaxID=69181 RepID=A0A8S9RZX3_BRACR|nr:hypothetical protein F2Q69_00028700 [Brassica cretica]